MTDCEMCLGEKEFYITDYKLAINSKVIRLKYNCLVTCPKCNGTGKPIEEGGKAWPPASTVYSAMDMGK